MSYRDSLGNALTLGKLVGEGGEGKVYRTLEQPGIAAKIYASPLSRLQVSKLETMVHAGDDGLRAVAAWPTATLSRTGRVVGFTMPLIASQHPLHDLIGPKRRQTLFPDAHWRFLIHTAANLARSFEVVHGRSIVVGDVNSNNVVVHGNSTTHLIDCDSFQVPGNGKVFRCNVGVAEYQPPELQGRDLSHLDRLPEHDLFGLAVMIFQLLFVGKHPFAGVLPARVRATGAIGDNVAARRFFYGQAAVRAGLRPPPGSLALSALPPQMAQLFERAFVGPPPQRPNAQLWRVALEDLETKTQVCGQQALHRHLRGAPCPWCALEREGLQYFALGGVHGRDDVDESIWRTFGDADVERVWAQIAAVKPPPQVDHGLAPARKYATKPLGLWPKGLTSAYHAGALVSLVGMIVLLALGQPVIAVCLAISAAGAAAFFRPDARAIAAARRRTRRETSEAFRLAQKDWIRVARNLHFLEERERLVKLRTQLREQRRRYNAERANVRRRAEQLERHVYLESKDLASARLPEIDARASAYLLSFGIETAADISAENLRRVPGVPGRIKARLLAWREQTERQFRYHGNRASEEKAARDLKIRHARERRKSKDQFVRGAALLTRIAREDEARRAALRAHAVACADRFRQAEADARISPFLYRT